MIRLFRIGGIPIRLDAGWFFVFGLIVWSLASGYFPYVLPGGSDGAYWAGGVVAALLLFTSVLLHELSHALVARAHGVGVAAITLHVFGGVSELETEPPDPRAEFGIAIIGPIVSVTLGGLAFAARQVAAGHDWLAALFTYLAVVNVVVGVFNLVPGFPLDGGRILRAMLWWWSGRFERASEIASRVGMGVAMLLAALGVARLLAGEPTGGGWFLLLGLFLFQAARRAHDVARIRSRLAPVTVASVMTPSAVAVSSQAAVDDVRNGELAALELGSLPVVDGDTLVGFLRRVDADRARGRAFSVAEVMAPIRPDVVVAPSDSAWLALTRLGNNDVGRVAVVDRGRLVGMVAREDVARALSAPRPSLDRAA